MNRKCCRFVDCGHGSVVLPGCHRSSVIGDTHYKIDAWDADFIGGWYTGKPEVFTHVKLLPVVWINGRWTRTQDKPIAKLWNDKCTLIERADVGDYC